MKKSFKLFAIVGALFFCCSLNKVEFNENVKEEIKFVNAQNEHSLVSKEKDYDIKFVKYLENDGDTSTSTEADDSSNEGGEKQKGFFLLPYFYVPIIAIVLGVVYLISFKTNKLVGSIESTDEKLSKLLLYKGKFEKVFKNENMKDHKKKKQIYKLLFKVRGHLYSIRYIIENMSLDNNIDNTELLDECNMVINSINAIDMKKNTLENLENSVKNLFEHDLTKLASISKRMLSIQKKYVETTYGKR